MSKTAFSSGTLSSVHFLTKTKNYHVIVDNFFSFYIIYKFKEAKFRLKIAKFSFGVGNHKVAITIVLLNSSILCSSFFVDSLCRHFSK